jgi:hypothetical protein
VLAHPLRVAADALAEADPLDRALDSGEGLRPAHGREQLEVLAAAEVVVEASATSAGSARRPRSASEPIATSVPARITTVSTFSRGSR